MPLTAWAWFITSCMGLTGFCGVDAGMHSCLLDHVAGTSFFVTSDW